MQFCTSTFSPCREREFIKSSEVYNVVQFLLPLCFFFFFFSFFFMAVHDHPEPIPYDVEIKQWKMNVEQFHVDLFWMQPAKTFVSPRRSPLGTFRAEEPPRETWNVPSGEERGETDVLAGYFKWKSNRSRPNSFSKSIHLQLKSITFPIT